MRSKKFAENENYDGKQLATVPNGQREGAPAKIVRLTRVLNPGIYSVCLGYDILRIFLR